MIQKIIQSGDPILRKKSQPVKKIDKKILKLVQDLQDTLKTQKAPEGVGLAAPQIGKNVRIFLANYKNFKRIVINPEILKIGSPSTVHRSRKSHNEILEGCLSLPYYYGPLKRANKVTLKYLNEKGEKITEEFLDFNAQIVLHEIDHLDGILFVDRLLEEKKPLYKVEDDEWEEVELI
ncbi:MAG TPA: peptide deformylase [Alphaproteobacteria bacterium]|jgi:peptide deformylase|nr:peptide deformylase [Alphaproteobacteria bacterium]